LDIMVRNAQRRIHMAIQSPPHHALREQMESNLTAGDFLAHPRAHVLMSEPWLWDTTDEDAPFGSDEGNDCFQDFREWRAANPDEPVLSYLTPIIGTRGDWGDLYTADLVSVTAIGRQVELIASGDIDPIEEIWRRDLSLIVVALTQLVLEGRLDAPVKRYAQWALQRQRHPEILRMAPAPEKSARYLQKISEIIESL